MKAGFWLYLIAGAILCAPAYAQEEDAIDEYFSKIDADKNDKVTATEMKNHAWAELEEGASERDKIVAWGPHAVDFVLSDADDDRSVTRKEFRDYIDAVQAETKVRFSTKDWEFYKKDYLDPYIELTLKEADKDGDKALSKAEFATLSDANMEEFAEMDKDGNGKVTGEEYTQLVKKYVAEYYDFEGEESADVSEKAKKNFALLDTNGNSFIEKDEWKAAMVKGKENRAEWWGVYVVFLTADTNEDSKVDIDEYVFFGRNQNSGTKHKFFPMDRESILDEVWKDVDTNEDGKTSRAEYIALFGDDSVGAEYDSIDTDGNGDVSRDEFWVALKAQFESQGYEFPDKDPPGLGANAKDETVETPENAADPMWDLYRKVGRTWTHRLSSSYAGVETVSHMKYEVIKVEKDHAVITITMLDKEKQPLAGLKPTEAKIQFKSAGGEGEAKAEVKDLGEEKVAVEAGEFTCKGTQVTVETSAGKSTTTTWMHAKYPVLIVKSESKTDDGSSVTELIEFND